jgi:hypothetical protein
LEKDQEEEKAYEVKDKRRVNPDGTLKDEAQASEPAAEEAPASEEAPEQEGETGTPSIYDMLQFVVGMLAEQAWYHMGVRIVPGQKEPVKDLVQAKVAIDAVAHISDQLHPHVSDEVRRALRSVVSDLQLNFVRQNQ